MTIYDEIGVRPLINAGGTLTRLGGSLMLPAVVDAMASAAQHFVDMDELHIAAGRRLAQLVGVEAAHVCGSATAGIALMTAACMTGTDPARIAQLPDSPGHTNRFLVQRAHRNPFDRALLLTGGRLIEVDADAGALAAAIDEHTAGVYYTFAWFCTQEALSLPQVAAIAHAAGVPVIVDAAAEVPPASNLNRYTAEGADLVVFSGGKGLRGPQASGLILGRSDLVEACRLNDCPNMGIGRAMKVDKESVAGLVKAVELYVSADHAAEMAAWERRVQVMLEAFGGLEGVRAWRQMPYGTGQLVPHAAVSWDEDALKLTHAEAARRLLDGDPRIAVQLITVEHYGFGGMTQTELRLHPHTLEPGQAEIVAAALKRMLVEAVRAG
ncbi:MAG: aminotransferase class V-fold PLP-dependent enzyme [Anaerolineae bacterium]